MPVSPWLYGDDGRVPLGVLAIPADAAMACAIIADLPAGTAITTSELAMRQIRPVRAGGHAGDHGHRAELGPPAPPVALAEVTVTDDAGTLIARGGSLCVILPFAAERGPGQRRGGRPGAGPGPDARTTGPVAAAGPGRRPVAAHRPERDGRRPRARPRSRCPPPRWLCAPPPGRVQGGAVAMLAGAAIDAAMQTAAPPQSRFVPLELKLNYLRPLASDGREATAHATLVHGGRRTAVARAEVADADGRAIAVASGSAIAERLAS